MARVDLSPDLNEHFASLCILLNACNEKVSLMKSAKGYLIGPVTIIKPEACAHYGKAAGDLPRPTAPSPSSSRRLRLSRKIN
jgi:hypothetical protein